MSSNESEAQKVVSATQDPSKVPYQLPQPTGMMPDIFMGQILDLDGDEQSWVPQAEGVSYAFRIEAFASVICRKIASEID